MPTDYIKLLYDSEGFKNAVNEQLALGDAYISTSKAIATADKEIERLSAHYERGSKILANFDLGVTGLYDDLTKLRLQQRQNISEQGKFTDSTTRLIGATDKHTTSSDRLITRMGRLSSFGRDLRQAGGFLGNDTLYALGSFADGMGDVAQSIDAVTKSQGKLSKVIGVGGAVLGGAMIGSSIYDATIGKTQGTDTGTILRQIGDLIRVGFRPDVLKAEVETAFLNAQIVEAGKFSWEPSKVEPGLAKELRSRGLGGDLSAQALQEAIAAQEKLLKLRIEEGDVVGSTVAMVATDLEKLKAAYKSLPPDEFAKSLESAMKRIGGVASSFGTLQSASQSFGMQRTGAARSYQTTLNQINQDVAAKRLDLAKSYSAQTLEADRQYYAQRAELAQQYGIETQRAEEDHQRNIRRLSQDHQKRLKKLVESRDALAVEDEIESYQDERQRADEDYQVAARRRSEDYANQLRQMEQAHREQEQQRRTAYNQQLVDLQTYAQLRRNQEAVEYGKLLRDIVEAFTKARNEFAASISNSNNVTTNKTANVTTNITGPGGGISLPLIEQTVYGAIEKAMR